MSGVRLVDPRCIVESVQGKVQACVPGASVSITGHSGLECGTKKPVSLKCQAGGCSAALGTVWALEFLLEPKNYSLGQKVILIRKGVIAVPMVFQSGSERPGQELGA